MKYLPCSPSTINAYKGTFVFVATTTLEFIPNISKTSLINSCRLLQITKGYVVS